MKEPQQQQTLQTDDEATIVVGGEEATRVSPRFDDEETLVARPVIPLAETPEPTTTTAPPAARTAHAPRRSWPLSLMLVSVLIGGVLGGAGLYFYQRQSSEDAAIAAPAQPETTTAEATQPPDAAPAQTEPTPAPTEAPVADATEADIAEADDDAEPAREAESVPAAGRREAPSDSGSAGAPKRGKKGEREEEVERRPRPRDEDDGPVADSDAPRARRVDSISYRPSRAERRAERRAARRARREAASDTDRVRRIFEGGPQ